MTKIYIAIWEDRHTDTIVQAFSNKTAAVEWAHRIANEYANLDQNCVDQPLTESMKRAGWVYCGEYSCEGDNVRVVEAVLDKMLDKN